MDWLTEFSNWISPPPPPPAPTIYETIFELIFIIVVTVVRILYRYLLFPVISFLIFRYMLDFLDPSFDRKALREAKKKLNKIMKKHGRSSISLNKHEQTIAGLLVDPDEMNTSWDDIGGLDEILKNSKRTIINPMLVKQNQIKVSKFAKPPQGVLLYGPPGCGKTTIAKAMAKESGCYFININSSTLVNKYYGESEKMVNAIFTFAEKVSPCIIFIDEIDALLSTRETGGHEVTKNIKTLFMTLWDGLLTDEKKTVIVMGATNRSQDLDPAIMRRMTRKFNIPLPNLEQRRKILRVILKDQNWSESVSTDAIANLTEGFSGADLEEVVREAVIMSLPDIAEDGINVPVYKKTTIRNRIKCLIGKLFWAKKTEELHEFETVTSRSITLTDFQTVVAQMKSTRQHDVNLTEALTHMYT